MKPSYVIGLRHDVDTRLGLARGVPLVMRIEDRLGVRSSFYVRVVLLGDENLVRLLRRAEARGWEIGLHLDNTYSLSKARRELEVLRSLGFRVRGVTVHGGLYGMLGEATWRVIDSLGLAYAHAGNPPSWTRIPVLPGHHTLDYYVGRYGEELGFEKLVHGLILDLRSRGASVLSSHPEYFVVSTGSMPVVESRLKPRARAAKILRRLSIILYTLLGRRKTARIYEDLVAMLSRHVRLLPLIDACKILYGSACPA